MSVKTIVSTIAAALLSAFVFAAPARADNAKDVGPEDGILCCNGLEQFLFEKNKVMVFTGRAGIFRSENRGENWKRTMNGLLRDDDVSPFVTSSAKPRRSPRSSTLSAVSRQSSRRSTASSPATISETNGSAALKSIRDRDSISARSMPTIRASCTCLALTRLPSSPAPGDRRMADKRCRKSAASWILAPSGVWSSRRPDLFMSGPETA